MNKKITFCLALLPLINLFLVAEVFAGTSHPELSAETIRNEYELAIVPVSNTGQYIMRVGDEVTFYAVGVKRNRRTGRVYNRVAPGKLFWSFDLRILQKTSGGGLSIRLRAIAPGTCSLKAVTTIKNVDFANNITIKINQ